MIPAAVLAKLATLGLTPEHAEAVASMLATVEDATRNEAAAAIEARRANDRERKLRQRHVNSRDITGQHVTSGDNPPPKEKSPTPPKEITPSRSGDKSPSLCAPDFFEDFWLVFPKREGPNPKKPARDRFHRLVAKGHDPLKLIEAARELSREHPSPTRFVPQAITWLNQERFERDEPALAAAADVFCVEGDEETRLHIIRYRNENNGHDPPRGIQAGKPGYMIPASWVRSMQLRRQANG